MESTYGGRAHSSDDPAVILEDLISRTIDRGGNVVIPAFAVGRAQALLYIISRLMLDGRIPEVPVYMDSPMSIKATKVFYHYLREHRLTQSDCEAMDRVVTFIDTAEESKAMAKEPPSKIILSASGMATGGRVLHHIKDNAPDARNTLVFSGFQAEETRGRRIVQGQTLVKMLGEDVPIQAEVVTLDGLSAHVDGEEMLEWLSHLSYPPRQVFITHGEEAERLALQASIKKRFNWQALLPHYQEAVELC